MIRRLFPWFRKRDPLLVANRESFAAFDRSRPLAEFDFVVCDTELTGLNKRKDEIISFGAVKVSGLHIELGQTFHSLVRPVRTDATQATLVHRITPEQLRNAPEMEEVLADFIRFCRGSVLVGHFIALDLHFISQATRKMFGGVPVNPNVDTMAMVRMYRELAGRKDPRNVEQTGSLVLDDLTREFNLPRFKPHDALEDALQTAYLFLFLAKKLREYGLVSLLDLESMEKTTAEKPLL